MTGVRRRGYFSAAVAVLGAAVIAALFTAPRDKPVDIRLVAPPPPPPEVVTATATTTVSAVGGVRPLPPPPPPPPPPGADPPPRHRPDHHPPPPPPPARPKPGPKQPTLFDLLRCDAKHVSDDDFNRCLEWPFDTEEFCAFLEENHLRPVDLRGPDGRRSERFQLDCDEG
ncbi:hypothetical protein [Lentzea sp. NPDC060358]|uniref:hypothetical protein n=1 Tax=Lentzea sp. NPDC060358 TaxID=3347103 RepID=UPI0036572BEF